MDNLQWRIANVAICRGLNADLSQNRPGCISDSKHLHTLIQQCKELINFVLMIDTQREHPTHK